ncbi:MAG: VOC family protein [Amaricoccus sp.]
MAHRSRLAGFIIDCEATDPAVGAAFWAAALGSGQEREDASYVRLDRQRGLHLEIQAVAHPSRVHLDIETDDIQAEVARLERLGARRIGEVGTWMVMEAPTGHRFCVIAAETPDFATNARLWKDE